MNKKQKKNMLLKEGLIIATAGIIIGIVFGLIISLFMTNILNILSKKIDNDLNIGGDKFLYNSRIDFKMIVPLMAIIFTTVFTYIITIISILLPIRKLNKISPIKAIRSTANDDIIGKNLKVPKIVKLIFKQEGELAYKNIRRDKSRYKTIVISIVVSIVLFLSINNLFLNYLTMHGENKKIPKEDICYTITLSMINIKEKTELNNLFEKLEEKNLMNDNLIVRIIMTDTSQGLLVKIPEEKITENMKLLYSTSGYENEYEAIKSNTNIKHVYSSIMLLSGDKYEKTLKENGLKKPGLDECIIIDTFEGETKYGKNLKLTNLEIGDEIEVEAYTYDELEKLKREAEPKSEEKLKIEQEILKQFLEKYEIENSNNNNEEIVFPEQKLKIVGRLEKIPKKFNINLSNINIIISEETVKKWGVDKSEEYKKEELHSTETAYIYTNDPEGIDNVIMEMRKEAEQAGKTISIFPNTFYKFDEASSYKGTMKKILVYSFISLIATLSCANIFITITSSISLRKKDIAELESIGMSNKQIRKMLFLEGLFYGLDAVIYGVLIGSAILYLIYVFIISKANSLKAFEIPYFDFVICIIVTYLTIFLSIIRTKKQVENQNIIEEIKNENI